MTNNLNLGLAAPPTPTAGGDYLADEDGRRDFTLGSVFAVAFAFISPIIALYAIFNLGLITAGPSFWWAFVVVLVGQLLVALIFGELSSKWPEEGGVYAWSRRLVGDRYAWLTGWVYICTLITLNAAAAFSASVFAGAIFGNTEPGTQTRVAFAIALTLIANLVSVLNRRILKMFIVLSIACEVVASLVVGTILLVFHRQNDFSVLLSGFQGGGAAFALGPFLAAVAIVGWAFVGFESAGDLAAEVKRPERNVPLAQIASLVLVAATVMYAGLALILSIPDLDAVAAGAHGDAIVAALAGNLGAEVIVPMSVTVCIGFTAGIAAVSSALSRTVHALAVRQSLPGSGHLVKLSRRDALPRKALLLTAAATCVVLLLSVSVGFFDVMIAMFTGGFYIAFLLPVAAMLVTRVRGMWTAGHFTLGTASGLIVNVSATVWLVGQIVNISWPRGIGAPWYVEWGCLLMYTISGMVGTATFLRRRNRSTHAVADHA